MTSSDKESNRAEESKYWSQVLAILIVCLAPFSTGLLWAWSSPFSLVITTDKENYDISVEDVSYFPVVNPLGVFIATAVLLIVGDGLGTKKKFWLMVVPHTASWIITIYARTKWHFYASRLMAGIGDALYFSSGPSYIAEITSPTVRGYFGNVPSIAVSIGLLIITAMGSFLSITTTAYICISVPLLLGSLMFFLPESPYQLIKNDNPEAAKRSLRWLTRKSNVEKDFIQLKADLERQLSEKGTYKELVTINSNVKALRAALLLRCSQQFSGIPVFSNYTQMIFQMAGGSLSPQTSSMIFIGACTFLTLMFSSFGERFGRRLTFFWSLLCSAIVLISMSVYFGLDRFKVINPDSFRWVPLAGMLVYILVYSPGVGLIPMLMLGELFSSSIKSQAMCVVLGTYGVSMLMSTYAFTLLNSYFGLLGPFLFYGICCLLFTFLSLRWVPETKGKTLEEIQQDLKTF